MRESEIPGLLWPPGAHRNEGGELWVSGCAVSRLAAEHGTPLYLFCEDTLRARARAYRAALSDCYSGGGEIAYAAKAYLCTALAQLLAEEGLGLDVVSGGELHVALRAGFPPEHIHFHGNNKSPAELRQALAAGVGRIVVDNLLELEILSGLAAHRAPDRVPIWLRLSTGITAHTHAAVQTGHNDTKFGFSISTGDAERALVLAQQSAGLAVVGLHCHIGSQITDPEPLAENARRLAAFGAEMRDRHGFTLRELSPGGGWGVPMTDDDEPAPVERYVSAIARAALETCRASGHDLPRLVLEPGRSIVAPAGVAVYRAGARKDIPGVRSYVSVDGGMADNIRPALYGASYTGVAIPKAPLQASGVRETVTIAGKFCESGDTLIRDIELPRVAAGDLVVVPMAGAYTLSMASNYNLASRPAVLLLHDGAARTIQRRETFTDLTSRDLPLHQGPNGQITPNEETPGSSRQPKGRRLNKYVSSGNDYVILDPIDWPAPPTPDLVQRICDRHRGPGSDGVLWGPVAPTEPFALRMFNPDGSEFEKSGNGLSIFARYLWDRRLPASPDFVIRSPGGQVTAHVLDPPGSTIGMELGTITFPRLREGREMLREPIAVAGLLIPLTAVSVGNPHCVLFREDLPAGARDDPLRQLGPELERLPLFPDRSNVQFVRVLNRHTLAVEIWERGAGVTLASGTSACAAAAAAIRLGRCDSPVTAEMPGGRLEVRIADDWSVQIICPVDPVFVGELSPAFEWHSATAAEVCSPAQT